MSEYKEDKRRGRLIAFLTREEIDFIDKLSKDALFSTGHKLSRTDVIRALIDAVSTSKVSADGVCSKKDLEKKLLLLMDKTLKETSSELKKEKEGKRDKDS